MGTIVEQLRLVAAAAAGRSLRRGEVYLVYIAGNEIIGPFSHVTLSQFVDSFARYAPELLAPVAADRYWLGIADISEKDNVRPALYEVEQLRLRATANSNEGE